MIRVRKNPKEDNCFPIEITIGTTKKQLTLKAFEELKNKLNSFKQ